MTTCVYKRKKKQGSFDSVILVWRPKGLQKLCIEEKGDSDKRELMLLELSGEFSAKKA